MSLSEAFRMRLRRKRLRLRARFKGFELKPVADRTAGITPGDHLVFTTLRNERGRLPFFLSYYRRLGVRHFLCVDNDSDDGSRAYLVDQPDVSLWTTAASYRRARFGVDWLNRLQMRHGHGHWTLVVDPDEFLVYPFCDTRPLPALTDWLESGGQRSLGAMLIDMYPKGPLEAATCAEAQDPLEIACWFDSGNYMISRNPVYHNLWIQGGPRARALFADAPDTAPSLNKIPLVKWRRHYAYVDSTHMLLPRGLNHVYDDGGGEKISGALLHVKFLDTLAGKAAEELERKQHYAGSREYRAYHDHLRGRSVLWNQWSEKYINWRQLEILGLMSKGNWA